MRIHHILKDGTRTDDISGHVVRIEDAESVYNLISKMNQRKVVKCTSDNDARPEKS